MKKIFMVFITLFIATVTFACPACENQQPRILKGITHGAGPGSNWDYVIVSVAMVIVVFTLYFSVKWMIRPGEKADDHIKRFILNIE